MKIARALSVIAITGAVLLGGPVAVAQTVDCSKLIRTEHEVIDVSKPFTGRNIGTIVRTASSDRSSYNHYLPNQVRDVIERSSKEMGINPALVKAVAMVESRGNQGAISPAGAIGVMQLMPGTARGLGVNPYDLEQNIRGGSMYLKRQLDRYQGSIPLALAAYNAGPGAVDKYQGIPPFKETRKYITDVMKALGRG